MNLLDIGSDFPLWQPFTPMKSIVYNPLIIEKGHGIYIYDQDGDQYIDAAGGLWNISFGLGNRKILAAMKKQMEKMAFGSLFYRSNPVAIELAARLVEITCPKLTRVFLTCSGSESIEVAIKVIRNYNSLTGSSSKKDIICLKRGYHGVYYGSGTASDIIYRKEDFGPNLPGIFHIEAPYCYRCPYGMAFPDCGIKCADELDKIAGEKQGKVAAFIMEPILGSAGIIVPPKEYFRRIETICKMHDIFFVLDEVATGFGRTGEMFAAELFNIEPDVLILSKGINSGYLPLGAALFCEKIFKPFWENDFPLQFGSTQDGNPVCCAASLATIDVLQGEGLLENCKNMGQQLKQGFREIMEKARHIGDVRGEGLMLGIELVQSKEKKTQVEPQHISFVVNFLKERGLLVYPNPCGISLFPALNVSEEEVHKILSILKKIFIQLRLGG
jgi:adenosylmethionine-8-amino-7-oxononanoate aminotransferase